MRPELIRSSSESMSVVPMLCSEGCKSGLCHLERTSRELYLD